MTSTRTASRSASNYRLRGHSNLTFRIIELMLIQLANDGEASSADSIHPWSVEHIVGPPRATPYTVGIEKGASCGLDCLLSWLSMSPAPSVFRRRYVRRGYRLKGI
jgi:hypothetical protein